MSTTSPCPSAIVTGLGAHLPDRVVTSEEIEDLVRQKNPELGLPERVIALVSGVVERRWADVGVTSSDLAAAAGRAALTDAGIAPSDIDLLVFASASHDFAEPATSNLVQTKTGCANATVLDVKNACNSFLNAVDIAHAYITTGRCKRALITAGEVLSPTIDWCVPDRDALARKFASFTLGDAGAAMVIEGTDDDSGAGLYPATLFSDGTHWEKCTVLSGGTLMWEDMSRMYFECDSAALHALAVQHVPPAITAALESAGWSMDSVVAMVPHQVSTRVIREIAAVIDYPMNRCTVTLDRYGNTAAASIPLAFLETVRSGVLERGARVLLVGAAAGFSTAVVPLVW